MITDQRNWISGLHGGGRAVREGTRRRDAFAPATKTESLEKGGRYDHNTRPRLGNDYPANDTSRDPCA
jgi:hypothetical protein